MKYLYDLLHPVSLYQQFLDWVFHHLEVGEGHLQTIISPVLSSPPLFFLSWEQEQLMLTWKLLYLCPFLQRYQSTPLACTAVHAPRPRGFTLEETYPKKIATSCSHQTLTQRCSCTLTTLLPLRGLQPCDLYCHFIFYIEVGCSLVILSGSLRPKCCSVFLLPLSVSPSWSSSACRHWRSTRLDAFKYIEYIDVLHGSCTFPTSASNPIILKGFT